MRAGALTLVVILCALAAIDLAHAASLSNHELRLAVALWKDDPESAAALHGPIGTWDTTGVSDMSELLRGAEEFNEDLRKWDVSNVTSLWGMFHGARTFNQSLSSI